MELAKPEFRLEGCERPQHLRVDQWYDRAPGFGVEPWIEPSEHEHHELKERKFRRRVEKWWHKSTDFTYAGHPSSDKLAEAKRQRFTVKGRRERIAKSLAVLSQEPSIQLPAKEWRQIVEDSDLEDQFS
jgi:hypothetical protein